MHTPNPEYISVLKKTVKESFYPEHMKMTLAHIAVDEATVVIDIGHCHLQLFGIVHGGVIATIIDTATFWAAFLKLPGKGPDLGCHKFI
ncbi:MAG: PaaI family thioesterase [Desulfobacula sp.]|jgi:acyl-coenzyme A thioesterase PaaI-like protein